MPKRHRPKPFRILVIPSSEDEHHSSLEDAETFRQVRNAVRKHGLSSASEYSFDTEAERDAFIDGYEVGIGYLGDGFYVTEDAKPRERRTP